MNYVKHYEALIRRARYRQMTAYVEMHHVVPRCMGGGNESRNLVGLTPEEHYVAHQLLVKIYPSQIGIVRAANIMGKGVTGRRAFGWLRRKLSAMMKGIVFSEEHRANLSKAMTGKKRSVVVRSAMSSRRMGNKFCVGRKFSEQTLAKMSAAKLGRKWSASHREKISRSLIGNKRALETGVIQ